MKKLYILFLFVFEFKVQVFACEKLSLENLTNSQEALEIQQAYRVLSPLKNETPKHALDCLLTGYKKGSPYLQYVSQEEKKKQKRDLKNAYNVLEKYGLHNKLKKEIESFLKRDLSQKPINPSFYNILNDDEELDENSFKELDEACSFSQSLTESSKASHEKNNNSFEVSQSSVEVFFFNQSFQEEVANLSLSSSIMEDRAVKITSIEEALQILHLTDEQLDIDSLEHSAIFFELDYQTGDISHEQYIKIQEAIIFLKSRITS